MHKKFWSWAELESTSFCLADLKKILEKLEAEEATLVWQLVEDLRWSLKKKSQTKSAD